MRVEGPLVEDPQLIKVWLVKKTVFSKKQMALNSLILHSHISLQKGGPLAKIPLQLPCSSPRNPLLSYYSCKATSKSAKARRRKLVAKRMICVGNGKNRCFAADILVNTIVTSSNFLIADVLQRDSESCRICQKSGLRKSKNSKMAQNAGKMGKV